ncbi:tetratricopeptide repeat protein [Xanthomonas arboricola]|uniref:tetratricopeptide repeat protein n=1 Tax=Xanthomonas arboricola TaxID=56448 RepID=UPI000C855478|nr:tetratricopeptide repeat protein [Xanthomonas arboricola]PPU24086.1 hypothetical protein XarCFBP6762_17570 [Xanthomonas arboricola]SOT97635.1 hypothetical protein CFBP6762_01653 [Xanthomonas arboricola pv. fragariae]
MRAPQRLHGLTLDTAVCAGPYPPQGFWTIAEGALGNGDCFGLYWPLGCEGETPVVCEMFHDEGRMVFSHSSLDVFAQWLDINHVLDEQAWDDESWDPRAHDVPDVDSPLPLIERAQLHVQAGEPSEAIELLQAACRRFPELQRAWTMLAVQHRRLGQHEAAVDAARAAILANWAFGIPDPSVLRLLRAAEAGNDPVLAMVQQMEFAFGGAKTNPDYAAMQVCIDRCWEAGDHLAALRLTQNRCYALRGETVSFQQREGFDLASWQHDFVAQCRSALRDDRQGM